MCHQLSSVKWRRSHPRVCLHLSDGHHRFLTRCDLTLGFALQVCHLFGILVETTNEPVSIDEHRHDPQQTHAESSHHATKQDAAEMTGDLWPRVSPHSETARPPRASGCWRWDTAWSRTRCSNQVGAYKCTETLFLTPGKKTPGRHRRTPWCCLWSDCWAAAAAAATPTSACLEKRRSSAVTCCRNTLKYVPTPKNCTFPLFARKGLNRVVVFSHRAALHHSYFNSLLLALLIWLHPCTSESILKDILVKIRHLFEAE